jgi:hypothetical protein
VNPLIGIGLKATGFVIAHRIGGAVRERIDRADAGADVGAAEVQPKPSLLRLLVP